MNISIVIPNYNGKDLLLKNVPRVIEALKQYKDGSVEVVIPDDASKDGSVGALKSFILGNKSIPIHILENTAGKNNGFSGNVNKGVKAAKGDIIILLNSDVFPKNDFLQPLLSHFHDEKVFAVGCLDESIEGNETVLRGRGVGKWEKGFLVHKAGSLDKNDTLWVSGGSGAFRKSIWDQLGGLNELYNPFYWEDIDLSYRAQKAGYIILFEKKSVVVHEHSKGAIKKNYSPFSVRKTAYRNQFFFTWLNATDTMLIAQHFIWMPYFFTRAIFNRDRAFFFGLFLALRKLSEVLFYRERIKRAFVKTDREVVEKFRKEMG